MDSPVFGNVTAQGNIATPEKLFLKSNIDGPQTDYQVMSLRVPGQLVSRGNLKRFLKKNKNNNS